jgi:serine/threonine-protein kinase
MIGTSLGHYKIVGQLGSGGMGVVYKALDVRLNRSVALKTMPPATAADQHQRGRFRREALAAASLSHPHICSIFDVGEQDNADYLVFEYLEGETLRQRLGRGPLLLAEALRFAVQIGEALAYAHSQGITHRDIKPANIFILERGEAIKILDFGIAKRAPTTLSEADATLTETGTSAGAIVGTPQYLSPEQALGKEVDHRSDLFSFGAVLYEMLTGRRAFAGSSLTEVLAKVLHASPEPVSSVNPAVPAGIAAIVERCLAKQPEQRYQSASEVIAALRSPGVRRAGTRRYWMAAAVVLLGGITAVGRWLYLRPKAIQSLAILPVVNVNGGPDLDYLTDGITETLINNVSQIRRLRVTSRNAVFRFKEQNVDAREIGRKLGAGAVLTGRLVKQGETLVISAELEDVKSARQLWGRQFTATTGGLLSMQNEIAREVIESLQITLGIAEQRAVAKRQTVSSEAYQLYLQGRYHWNKRTRDGLAKALEFFQRATLLDSRYALAHVGLAETYMLQSGVIAPHEVFPKARQAVIRALEIDEALAEGHTALGFIKTHYDWDWLDAEREFRRALQLNSSYPGAHSYYARYLNAMGRFEEALEHVRSAQQLDPLALGIGTGIGLSYYFRRDYSQAVQEYRKILELEPGFAMARCNLAAAYALQGRLREAVVEYEQGIKSIPGDAATMCELAQTYARLGRTEDAKRLLAQVLEMTRTRYVSPPFIAWVFLGLGHHATALEWLARGYEERAWPMIFLKVEPRYDPLRKHAQFMELLRKMAL